MSIGVNANGKFYIIPQVISTLDASALDTVEQGAQGILAIIGEGTGLIKPGTVTAIQSVSGIVNRLLFDSPLRKAINFAINPSNETPGASDIRIILVNPAAQSTYTMQDVNPDDLITFTAAGWGPEFNAMTISVDATAKTVTFVLDLVTEVYTYVDNGMQVLVDLINDRSSLVSAVLVAEGVPVDVAATNFTGGAVGTTTNQNWLDAFDALDANDIDLELLVSPDPVIQSLWGEHLDNDKRFGFTGYGSTNTWNTFNNRQTSITNLLNAAANLGSRQVVFAGVGTDDEPSYVSTAAKYAGIAAGMDPPNPVTNKDLSTITVEADLADPEIEALLLGGVAPPMRRRNRQRPGFVCSRSLTTWTADDNLFNREFSVGRGARAIEREIKNQLEQYVGKAGEVAIVGRAVATVDRVLAFATRSDVSARIVSYDRKAIKGVLEGTVLKIFYTFVPILPINFPFAIGALLPTVITKTVELNLAPV